SLGITALELRFGLPPRAALSAPELMKAALDLSVPPPSVDDFDESAGTYGPLCTVQMVHVGNAT
ncbi:MAG: hypothetical protein MHM6MM_007421, partial [Cercozoa sp. M6MM]